MHLKADGLMLVFLAKLNELKKSALDMNHQFLELQLFLQQLKYHPEEVMDAQCKIFPSENRLYGDETLVNHCLHSQDVKKRLFTPDEWDTRLVYPSMYTGVASMEDYWSVMLKIVLLVEYTDSKTKAILGELSPSNDLHESILGLNDYLTTAMPSMHQMTRSNLIEVKKNKTIQWINHLPEDQFKTVVNYAIQKRGQVRLEYREEEAARSNQRREQIVQAKRRRDALQLRAEKERNKLSQLHLIASPEELTQALAKVDKNNVSASKKKAKKLDILKTPVRIRKKVLKQGICITFTQSRRQRPLEEIVKNLSDFIAENPPDIPDAASLVGRRIHVTNLSWLKHIRNSGTMGYDVTTKLHEVIYDGEEDHCYFDLTQDLITGDLKILECQVS